MSSKAFLAVRNIGDSVGLPTSLAYVLLIGVPILVIGSTGLLCFYYMKARSSKRERNRFLSKSSQNSAFDGDQEMALTSVGATFRPPTAMSSEHSFGFVGPTDKIERRVVAGHVKGAGSEVFDVQQYENERANQRSRDMILPSPTTISIRPKTAPNDGRPQNAYPLFERPMDYNRLVNPPQLNHYTSNEVNRPLNQNRSKAHRRSASLGKPPPIRPSRPTHSPAGSVRSLSVFPHRHCLLNSPTVSQHSHPSPSLTPSPPLLSPLAYNSRSPPPPPPVRSPQHVRHPSIDRNSLMPIAPILFPSEKSNPLPTVDERSTLQQDHWIIEEWRAQDKWLNRQVKNYI